MGANKGPEKYIKFLIYIVVVVLINIVGVKLFERLDLTKNKVYSLSDASKQVVASLSEPFTINVFFTKNLPAPHNNTEQYLRDLLEEYGLHSNHFFNYRFIDVSPIEDGMDESAKENQELAKNYGIFPVQVRHIEKDEVKFKKAYMGLVLIHGDLIEKIPTILSTEGLEYKLTMAIKKLNNKVSTLVSLSDKIRVKLFMSSSLNNVAPYIGVNNMPSVPSSIQSAVDRLNGKVFGKLEYSYYDPSKNPDHAAMAQKYGLTGLKWPDIEQGKIKSGEGTIGLVMEYGDKKSVVQLLNVFRIPIIGTQYQLYDMENVEELINENIESLVDINEQLGYLADHGTHDLGGAPMGMMPQQQQGLKNFDAIVSKSYSIKDVKLADETIPESLDCLVIAGPKEKFTDYELFQIDQYLMKGKNIAVFLDSFNEIMIQQQQQFGMGQGPTYIPIDTGLEKLLAHYGVSINKSYVMDENCYKQPMRGQAGGMQNIYFAPLIKGKNINQELDFMKNIKGLVTMKASPLTIDEEKIKKSNLTAHTLFSSSKDAWEMSGRINLNPMFIMPPKEDGDKRSMPLACLLEGSFTSFFEGKQIPEKEIKKDEDAEEDKDKAEDEKVDPELAKIKSDEMIITKGKPGKLFVVATSELVKDTMLDPDGISPNATFVMNVIDVLNGRNQITEMRSKDLSFNPLDESDAGTKTAIKLVNIAGLPAFVVLFGLGVFISRKAKRRRIQMMFQQ